MLIRIFHLLFLKPHHVKLGIWARTAFLVCVCLWTDPYSIESLIYYQLEFCKLLWMLDDFLIFCLSFDIRVRGASNKFSILGVALSTKKFHSQGSNPRPLVKIEVLSSVHHTPCWSANCNLEKKLLPKKHDRYIIKIGFNEVHASWIIVTDWWEY